MTDIEQALIELRDAERLNDSAEALKTAVAVMDKLTPEDRRKLLDLPAVQRLVNDAEVRAAEKMTPGSLLCDSEGKVIGKVPWTWNQMVEQFGTVDWTPPQSRTLCINGIDLWVEAMRPVRTPPQFRDVAMEAWRAEQSKVETDKEIVRRNFGNQGLVLNGDGTPA